MMNKKRFWLFSPVALLSILLLFIGCNVSETTSYPPGDDQISIRGLKPAAGYDLPALGANFVELEWHFSIDSESWEITADKSEREMKKKIARAHEQGLGVYLLPFLHFKDKPGAVGAATAPDLDRFLAQLDSLAVEWATFAEENKVELFTPVNELQHWVGREEGNIGFIRASEWYQRILPKIRKVYSGELITGYNSFFYDLISQNVSDYEINQTGYDYISLSVVPHRIKNYDDYTLLVDHLMETAEYWKKKFGAKGIMVTEVGVPESSDSLPFYQHGEQQGESYGMMRAHLYDIFFSRTVGKMDGFFISDWGSGEAPFYLDENGKYVVRPQGEETSNVIKKYYVLEGEREALEWRNSLSSTKRR